MRPPRQKPYEYVNSYYGLNVEPGQRVSTPNGKHGLVVAKRCYDHYVHVKFDGCRFDVPVHPMDLVYGDPSAAVSA
jgi:hypothetical protein